MSTKIYNITIILIFFILFSINSYSQEKKSEILEIFVQEALENNPQLRAAKNNTSAFQAKIPQMGAWSPPQFGVEFYQTPIQSFPNPIQDGMETDYFIQQMIHFPGKLSAMENAAKNNADMAEQNYEALKRKVIRDLKSTYYMLYLIQREIEINAENQELLKQFYQNAMRQYETGMGKKADILRAQTELSALITEGINLQKEKELAEAMLNTILNRPIDSSFGDISDVSTMEMKLTFEQLLQLAIEQRPELRAMQFNIDMQKAELQLARIEYFPDLMVRAMYKDMKMTNNDYWSLMIGFEVPEVFWSFKKVKSKVQENQFKIKNAEEELTNMINMVKFEVKEACINIQTNYNLILHFKNNVIPQAEQVLKTTILEYQTGNTEFLMLIDAYRMVLMAKLDYYMKVKEYNERLAQLEQAVGLSLMEIDSKIN